MRPDLLGSTTGCGAVLVDEALHGVTKVAEQVPSVGDLNGIRRTLPDPVGISARPITGNDLHARMLAQPGGDGCGFPIGQEIDDGVRLKIHHHRAVASAPLPRPVVDPENPRGRSGCLAASTRQCRANERVRAGRNREPIRKARTSLTAERQRQVSLYI
jgi:hypothetical protein